MAIAFVNSASNTGSGTSLAINVPASTADGHVMVAILLWEAQDAAPTATGWTVEATQNGTNGSDAMQMRVLTKVASSEGSTHTFTTGGASADVYGYILTFSGVDTGAIWDGTLVTDDDTSRDTTAVASGVTTSNTDSMLVCAWGVTTSHTLTVPGSMTELGEVGGTLQVAREALSASGATGTRNATIDSNDRSTGFSGALRASSPNATVTPSVVAAVGAVPAPTIDIPWGGPTYRSHTVAEANDPSTTLTITKPSGTVQDDVMIALVQHPLPDTITVTPPSGWTAFSPENVDLTDSQTFAYWKVAGASEPADYTWTFNTGYNLIGAIITVDGADTSDPINGTPVHGGTGTSGSWSPSITTDVTNCLLVAMVSLDDSGTAGTFSASDSMTERFEQVHAGSVLVHAGYTQQVVAAQAYQRTFTFTKAIEVGGLYVAVQPPGGTNATPTPSVVAAVAAVPAPTVSGTASLTTTVVAAVGDVPAPTVVPEVAVPQTTVPAVASAPAPTVTGNADLTATVVAAASAVPAPIVVVDQPVDVVTVAAAGDQPAVTIDTSTPATATPASVDAVADVPAPSTSGTALVTPSATGAISDQPAVSASGTADAVAVAVAATGAVPEPGVSGTALVEPGAVAGVADQPAPAVTAGGSVTVPAVAVDATADQPAVVASGGASATPGSVDAVGVVPAPSPSGNAQHTATSAVSAAGVPAPVISLAEDETVTTTTVAGVSDVPSVTVTTTSSVTVEPVIVAAATLIGEPTVSTAAATIVPLDVPIRVTCGVPIVVVLTTSKPPHPATPYPLGTEMALQLDVSSLTISSLSREYVKVLVEGRRGGQLIDPTPFGIDFAFITHTEPITEPGELDFLQGSWEVANTSPPTYRARVLVGPGSDLSLTDGHYDVWVRLADSVEQPVRMVGRMIVT